MSESLEFMSIYTLIVFSLGMACFIASCDSTALSKGKQLLRYLSFCNFFVFGFIWLLIMIFRLFD